jgi:hypothetical protein
MRTLMLLLFYGGLVILLGCTEAARAVVRLFGRRVADRNRRVACATLRLPFMSQP